MMHKINETLYRIRTYTGMVYYVECDNEEELCKYVADLRTKGYIITSVSRMDNDGSTPRIAISNKAAYILKSRRKYNELL